MAVIALDLGGTKIASAIIEENGTLRCNHKNLLGKRKGHEVGQLIVENLKRQFNKAEYYKLNIESVGICIPGCVNQTTGRVWAPNIAGWDNYPLAAEIRQLLGMPNLKVYVESDRSCALYGELWQGAAKDCRNAVLFIVGTGIGAGLFVDGRMLHGASDIVGATGWMALESPYDSKFDAQGCFEYYASGSGICSRAKEAIYKDKSYRGELRQMPISRITTQKVFEAYYNDDPIAFEVVEKAVQMWGMATANFVSLLNPEKIIWGGGVFCSAYPLIDRIYEEALKWAQPLSIKSVKLERAQLSEQAGIMGAGFLALKKGVVEY